jgi:hypothetical protein
VTPARQVGEVRLVRQVGQVSKARA